MWVIFLEAALALSLLLLMVWATWPKRTRKPDPGAQDPEGKRNE